MTECNEYLFDIPKEKIPIAIIGAGGIVKDAHLPAYKKAGFEVRAIYNRTMSKADKLASDFSISKVFVSLGEMVLCLGNSVIYDIAVNTNLFLETLEKLPDNSYVLIQKPFGENLDEALTLRNLCQKKNITAAVNCQLRFSPPVLEVRKMIKKGVLGEIHDIEMKLLCYTPWAELFPYMKEVSRLEIVHHSIHYIDLIRSFLGNPDGIYAKTVKHPNLLDFASVRSNIIMDYGDIIRANINTNHCHQAGEKNQESYFLFEGTRGSVKFQIGLLLDYPMGREDLFEYCIYKDGKWIEKKIDGTWFPDAFIGTMGALMRKRIDKNSSLPNNIDDLVDTMRCVEAAYISSESGGTRILRGGK